MAAYNGNALGDGLLGGAASRNAGKTALYGGDKTRNPIRKDVDLTDPKAMRAEATRLQKAGNPTEALKLINAADQQQRAAYTNSQHAAQTAEDAKVAAKAKTDTGRIPAYAEKLRASPTTAHLADLLENGDITIEEAGLALSKDVQYQAAEARRVTNDVTLEQNKRFAEQDQAWQRITFDNTQKQFSDAQGDDASILQIQSQLATEMAASEVGNPAIINLLNSGKVLTPDFIKGAEAEFRKVDPNSIAAKEASADAYGSLTSTIKGLVSTGVVDQEGFDSITAMGARLEGQPAAVIDAYTRTIGTNARRLGSVPRAANGLEIDYAYSQSPAIASALDEVDGFFDSREGEVDAFTLQLATLTPAYAQQFGVDSTLAAQSIMQLIEEGLAADPNFSATDLSDRVTDLALIEKNRVKVDIDKVARAARAAARNAQQ